MAIAQKGAISFGLVHIPVSLYTATQDNDISFNQLHKTDQARIRYKKVCSHCGKEVRQEDIVRGYQFEKDRYVTVSDAEIEKIKTEKDRTIRILHFCQLDEISPIYYDRAYQILPDKGGDRALELLRAAMMETARAAIGKCVFGSTEKLLVIIPRASGMLIQTLMYAEDIKQIPASHSPPPPQGAELSMAKTLIGSMTRDFDPSEYNDEFQEKLRRLIDQKISGKEISAPKAPRTERFVDLLSALKASVEQSDRSSAKKSSAKKSNAKRKVK